MKFTARLYIVLLFISILVLLLDIFFLKVQGAIGLALCILCVYLVVGCLIRLIRLSQIISDIIMEKIDILFF